MSKGRKNVQRVRAALAADPGPLVDWATQQIIGLGALSEWSLDDNFAATESLVELASASYGLPSAGDQSDSDLRFYGKAAQVLGLPNDLEDQD